MFGRIKPLPPMAITNTQPAFYDIESKSVIGLNAKFYTILQNLVDDYNKFVVEINTQIQAFEDSTEKNYGEFTQCVKDLMTNYIESIDTKIVLQNNEIADAIQYMKDNLISSVNTLITELVESGNLYITTTYDAETEALNFVLTENNG